MGFPQKAIPFKPF